MDDQLIAHLYKTYKSAMYHYALSLVHNEHKAADVVQAIFTSLLQRNAELAVYTDSQLRVYLMIRVRGEVHNSLRKKEIPIGNDSVESMVDATETIQSAEETAINIQNRHMVFQQVQQALEPMPEHYKDILNLRYQLELSYQEIGEIMHITEGNARLITMRARTLLRRNILDGEHNE